MFTDKTRILQDYSILRARAIKEVSKFNKLDLLDDFIQFAALAILRGRKATVKQLFVDFIRNTYGDTRFASAKFNFKHCVQFEPAIHGESTFMESKIDFDTCIDYVETSALLGPRYAAILVLYFKYDYNLADIAKTHGISEGRVSQLLNHSLYILKKYIERTNQEGSTQ